MSRPLVISIALALAATGGCDAVGPASVAAPISIEITPATLPRLLVGDSVQLIAIPRDANGNPTSGRVSWASSQSAVATVSGTGYLIVVGTGAITITATSGGVTQSIAGIVSDPTASERFAFAFANQPAAASYQPLPDLSYNGFTNGPPGILVTRAGTGSYRVWFRGLGRGPLTEVVLTTAVGETGIRCVPERWGRLSNPRDLDALVLCSAASGVPADSPFTILVVGQASLPGMFAFSKVNTTTPAGSAVPGPSWSSSGTVSAASMGVGLTDLRFGMPIATTDNFNTYVTAYGTASIACRSLGRNTADVLSVRCTDPTGTNSHADFAALAIGEGRPGRRFAMAYSDQTGLATYNPYPTYAKNSAGGPVTGHRHGLGSYRIAFGGWGTLEPQAVIVSAFVEAAFCNHVSSYLLSRDSMDQGIDVACFDSAGLPADSRFTILVIE